MNQPTQHATARYINAYREMWDGEDKNDTEEVSP